MYSPPSPVTDIARTVTVPDDGYQYWQFTPDNPPRQDDFDYPGNQLAYPQTAVIYTKPDNLKWVPLPEEWQWFQLDLLKLDAPGQTEVYYLEAYESLVADHRAFTDLHDKDEYTDYVLGRNLERDEPYFWKVSITCKGNIVRGYQNGSEIIITAGLDVSQPPPAAEDVYDQRWLVHYVNQVYPDVLSNDWPKVTHFPQIKNLVDGKMEKTGTSIPFFLPKTAVSRSKLVQVYPGEAYVVNLSRDLE